MTRPTVSEEAQQTYGEAKQFSIIHPVNNIASENLRPVKKENKHLRFACWRLLPTLAGVYVCYVGAVVRVLCWCWCAGVVVLQ